MLLLWKFWSVPVSDAQSRPRLFGSIPSTPTILWFGTWLRSPKFTGDSHIHIHLRKTDAVIALNACTNTLALFCYLLCNYVYCRVGKQYLDSIYKKKKKQENRYFSQSLWCSVELSWYNLFLGKHFKIRGGKSQIDPLEKPYWRPYG